MPGHIALVFTLITIVANNIICVIAKNNCGETTTNVKFIKPFGYRVTVTINKASNVFICNVLMNHPNLQQHINYFNKTDTIDSNQEIWLLDHEHRVKNGEEVTFEILVLCGSSHDCDNYETDKETINVLRNECQPSKTKVLFSNKDTICSGDIILQDSFNGDKLNKELWRVEQYIPEDHIDNPFVSFQRSAVEIFDNSLIIRASPQHTQSGFDKAAVESGVLNLYDDCTGTTCERIAKHYNILPPVVTGRVTSTIPFIYGNITVRAKVPTGNYLYPEIALEFIKNKQSLIKITSANGNAGIMLTCPMTDLNYYHTKNYLKGTPANVEDEDSNEFYNYTLHWSPELLEFSRDGDVFYQIYNTEEVCPSESLTFDKFLCGSFVYLTLGLLAGGTTEFEDPDGWTNTNINAPLEYYMKMLENIQEFPDIWKDNKLEIKHVQVTAL